MVLFFQQISHNFHFSLHVRIVAGRFLVFPIDVSDADFDDDVRLKTLCSSSSSSFSSLPTDRNMPINLHHCGCAIWKTVGGCSLWVVFWSSSVIYLRWLAHWPYSKLCNILKSCMAYITTNTTAIAAIAITILHWLLLPKILDIRMLTMVLVI